MNKYKIYKFTDGNHKEWYQVKVKCWFLWSWLGKIVLHGEFPLHSPTKYTDLESAQDAIKNQETMHLSRQIKKIEIIDNIDKNEISISSDALNHVDQIVKKYTDYLYDTAFKQVKNQNRKTVEVSDIDRVSREYIGWGSGSCKPLINCQENTKILTSIADRTRQEDMQFMENMAEIPQQNRQSEDSIDYIVDHIPLPNP